MQLSPKGQVTISGEDAEEGEPRHTAGGNMSWWGHCGKQYGGSPNIKNRTATGPSNPISGYLSQKRKQDTEDNSASDAHCSSHSQQDTETSLVSSSEERIKKTWGTHTMEEYAALRKKSILGGYYAKGSRPDTERQTLHATTCKWNLNKWNSEKRGDVRKGSKPSETPCTVWLIANNEQRAWDSRRVNLKCPRPTHKRITVGDGHVSWLDCGDHNTRYIYVKTPRCLW